MTSIERMKMILREEQCPLFTDDELQFYLDENDGNEDNAIYQCLIIKSESTAVNVSGLTTSDSSSYFRRLASHYKPNNSGTLGGG
jgi:hypothetical protein